MSKLRFEKFEMKYGCFLPSDFKQFMYKYGGDVQFGSCRFEYPENIINNLLRIPGEMDIHLIPFGDIGNGDFYCFYKYGSGANNYYVGIWLHETRNFVILASSFKSFMYKCMLDDYMSIILSQEEDLKDDSDILDTESIERCKEISIEYGFDFEKVKKMKNEFDYHRLMVEYDTRAVQSLCYLGKNLTMKNDVNGFSLLNSAKEAYPFYTAPYYITAKALMKLNQDSKFYLLKAMKTSMVMTGYSYWEEDFIEIPEDVHREIALFADQYLKNSDDYFNRSIYNGKDPYDYELRHEMAKRYAKEKNFSMAMIEYNNALFCCEDKLVSKDILKDALMDSIDGGLHYLSKIIEHDIKLIR